MKRARFAGIGPLRPEEAWMCWRFFCPTRENESSRELRASPPWPSRRGTYPRLNQVYPKRKAQRENEAPAGVFLSVPAEVVAKSVRHVVSTRSLRVEVPFSHVSDST